MTQPYPFTHTADTGHAKASAASGFVQVGFEEIFGKGFLDSFRLADDSPTVVGLGTMCGISDESCASGRLRCGDLLNCRADNVKGPHVRSPVQKSLKDLQHFWITR
jgi:hypothetical protein